MLANTDSKGHETNLGNIVGNTRTTLGYIVYPEIGLKGKILKMWNRLRHRTIVSDYDEYAVLKDAASLTATVMAPSYAFSQGYDKVDVHPVVAEQFAQRFEKGMETYLKYKGRVSHPQEAHDLAAQEMMKY